MWGLFRTHQGSLGKGAALVVSLFASTARRVGVLQIDALVPVERNANAWGLRVRKTKPERLNALAIGDEDHKMAFRDIQVLNLGDALVRPRNRLLSIDSDEKRSWIIGSAGGNPDRRQWRVWKDTNCPGAWLGCKKKGKEKQG
jgi:hypothetical protein